MIRYFRKFYNADPMTEIDETMARARGNPGRLVKFFYLLHWVPAFAGTNGDSRVTHPVVRTA